MLARAPMLARVLSLAALLLALSLGGARPAAAAEHEATAAVHDAPAPAHGESAAAHGGDDAAHGGDEPAHPAAEAAPAASHAETFSPSPGSVTVPVETGPPPADEALPAIPAPAPPQAAEAEPAAPTPATEAPAEPAPTPHGRIALIVTGLGLSEAGTQAVLDALPRDVAVAFHPRAPRLQYWIDTAKAGGHAALLLLPMEPSGYPLNDPGPQTLLVRLDADANGARVDAVLNAAKGYDGILSEEGDRFTVHADAVEPVLKRIAARHSMFIDARTSEASTADGLARQFAMPHGAVTATVDTVASPAAIDAGFSKLDAAAARDGSAIGLLHPTPIALQRLKRWLENRAPDAAVLAPLAAVVDTGAAGR